MNIAINGFGRIGRAVFKLALENKIKVVAINDIHGSKDAEYLLKYDSVYGRFKGKIKAKRNSLVVNGKSVKVLSERDPGLLPWKELKVDVVVESTGVFRDREGASKHLEAGAKKVLISAPAKNPDFTVVLGVNHKKLNKNHKIISVASCTTNCLAPVVKVLNDKFGIKRALMTTVHAYTNDQVTQDSPHKKVRRGRAAALNMIPTTTGASKAVTEVIPQLKGKIEGVAVRVPVACGSLVDLSVELKKKTTADKLNRVLKKAARSKMKGVLEYTEDEIVSSDIIENPHSSIVDGLSTKAMDNFVKVFAWYDNEYGYSCRMIDVIKMLK